MATFEITEGAPGQGKSLYTARLTRRLLVRNRKWEEKGNPRRRIASNMRFSEAFEAEWSVCSNIDDMSGYIVYWTNADDICKMRDVDVIWDEIATELDARNWPNLSVELKRFLSQYRKRGVDIYANTQDFSMIDMRARLMITNVATLTKILGSRDLSTTKPAPRFIWGIIMIRQVQNFKETDPEKKKYDLIPSFMLIERELTEIYDTRQDIPLGEPTPFKHIVRKCEFYGTPGHVCEEHAKIMHI